MTVELDHLIVRSRDKRVAAAFLADMLGLPTPVAIGPTGKQDCRRRQTETSQCTATELLSQAAHWGVQLGAR